MVRLEITTKQAYDMFLKAFTFQYGQIRNEDVKKEIERIKEIYIPVWLDQK